MKIIITEEEKNRIIRLHEKVGEKLPPDRLASAKAKYIKDVAKLLNQYYNIKLTSAIDGDWWSKEYNDTLEKFLKEKGYKVKYCKTGDGYCPDGDDGRVYIDEEKKVSLITIISNELNKQKSDNGKINTTNDKAYDYKLLNNRYYYKGKPNTPAGKKYPNWVEATGNALNAIKSKVKF